MAAADQTLFEPLMTCDASVDEVVLGLTPERYRQLLTELNITVRRLSSSTGLLDAHILRSAPKYETTDSVLQDYHTTGLDVGNEVIVEFKNGSMQLEEEIEVIEIEDENDESTTSKKEIEVIQIDDDSDDDQLIQLNDIVKFVETENKQQSVEYTQIDEESKDVNLVSTDGIQSASIKYRFVEIPTQAKNLEPKELEIDQAKAKNGFPCKYCGQLFGTNIGRGVHQYHHRGITHDTLAFAAKQFRRRLRAAKRDSDRKTTAWKLWKQKCNPKTQ